MNINKREIKVVVKTVAITIATLGMLGAVSVGLFIYSGVYDISAGRPHLPLTQTILTQLKRRSVENYADSQDIPDLTDPNLVKLGFSLYREQCVACHGAPGQPRERIGMGLNPNPPPLLKTSEDWQPHEIAWIIANGLKMAGMPAFSFGQPKKNIWALTAFVIQLNTLTPVTYKEMEQSSSTATFDRRAELKAIKTSWKELENKGNPAKGKKLLISYGCHKCHAIPGTASSASLTAVSLQNFRERHYIAGQYLNEPTNLVNWITDPTSFDAQTGMPDLDVTIPEAWLMASYIYRPDEIKQQN